MGYAVLQYLMKQLNLSKTVMGQALGKPSSLLAFLCLSLIITRISPQDFSVTIAPGSSTQINQVADYQVSTTGDLTGYDIPKDSIFLLTFPPQYNTTLLRSKAYSGFSSINGDQCYLDPVCTGLTISFVGNSFAINGIFTSALTASESWYFTYTIFAIQNPSSFVVGSFSVTIYKGTTIYYPKTSLPTTSFTSTLYLQSANYTIQMLYPTIWGVSPLKLTITPSNLIDSIEIKFPSAWTGETTMINGALTSNATVVSLSNPSILFTFSSSVFTITNLYYYTPYTPIDITVNSIFNPSAMRPAGTIILTLSSNSTKLEQSSFSIPASSFTNDVVRNQAVSLTNNTTSSTIQLKLFFQLSEQSVSTDRIYITFPPDLVITNSLSYTLKMASKTVTPSITNNLTANTIYLNVTNGTYQVSVEIVASGIARPRQCKTTSNFTIKTYRLNQFLMESSTCCSIQIPNRQTLTIISILPSDSQHLKTSNYTFNFSTSAVTLIATDQIQIIFPPQYFDTIKSSNNASLCSKVSILGVNTGSKVKTPFGCSVYMNQIVLSSFLSGDESGSSTIVVNVEGVVNPAFTPTTGFTISTLSSSKYVLEQAQGYMITILPNILTSFTVTATSQQTYATDTKYVFSLGNNSPLTNGYTIKITFPSEYSYINYNSMKCQINSISAPCTRLNSTYHTSTLAVIVKVNRVVNTITTLSISSVTNPVSQKTTGNFTAIVYDETGSAVESSNTACTYSMNSLGAFTLFTASAIKYFSGNTLVPPAIQLINSDANSLWIRMVFPSTPLPTPASILITISNANRLQQKNTFSTCKSSQLISPSCTISVNAGTNNIEIALGSLNFASIYNNFLEIQVTYLFFKDYQNIQIGATFSVNNVSSLSPSTPARIDKLYAQPVSNYSVTFTSRILGQSSNATLTIGLSTLAQSQASSFVVYIPQDFGVSSRVTFPIASFTSNQLVITGLTNPTTQNYSPFLFAVYNANGNLIAFSSPNDTTKIYTFIRACALPCRNCSGTVCLDCYTTISWIPQIYLSNATKTCVANCSTGEYLSSGVCYACDTTCQTCLMYGSGFTNGNSTYCLTCPSNLLFGTTCVSACPSGYYSSSQVCEPCMANCLNCTDSSTCAACKVGLSLYNSQCLLTCPDATVSYTDTNTSLSSCRNCPSNCSSCSSLLAPLCLSCVSGYYLYNGACYSSCSNLSLYISYQMTCASCQCANCTTYAYICNVCSSPYNLYQSQCILTCPSGYYPSSNVCQTCQANCLQCNSSQYCSLCQIPNALYITNSSFASCYSSCPNNTIATIDSFTLAYVCQSCGGNCLTCQTSITFCLSCQPGYILNNNTCASSCPSGLWLISGLCRSCAIQCQLCSSSDPYNCTLCSPNYFYYNYTCNSTCPDGTYSNVVTSTCSTCNLACKTCVNSTNCTTCANTSYFYQYFCYSNCSSINATFYSFNGSCMACQSQCSACLTTPLECVTCASSEYYFNPVDKSCAFSCSLPYYINGSICSPCQSPCTTCDTLYNTCSSCSGNLSLWMGSCISSCPSGFYTVNNTCNQCSSTCLTCNSSACITCQPYAYRYYQTCILSCQGTDLPITIGSYCTNCAQVPYCQSCQSGSNNNYVCFVCIYPYVIFDGNCLNQCPNFYTVDSSNKCVQSPSYSAYKNELYLKNYPYFPPFGFVAILFVTALVLWIVNTRIYKYVYHYGYLIALSASIQLVFLLYGLRYAVDLYTGDYTDQNKYVPAFILTAAFLFKVTLSAIFVLFVIGKYYLNDIRFRQWKEEHEQGFKVSIVLTLVFGARFFKLYYSKMLGRSIFSYRIVSVQKFYYEDVFTWISLIGDIVDLAAFANINYNIFISYSVLYLLSFELIVLKVVQWFLLARDFKKPDRGFFLGDEEEAERMIQQELQAKQRQKRKFEMESLVKLIRRKSAENLYHQKLYENLFFDDFRSVYDPNDYEDVPKVPNRKIEKNINKGKFRKGKRITIQQKLKRFAESIKPTPPVPQDNGYLRGLIYWKPPKQVKVQKKAQGATIQSQQSMMKLLQDKQLLYEDISSIHIIDLDDDNGTQHQQLQSRYKKRKRTGLDQDTVINDLIYDPNSIEFIDPLEQEENDLNGLWNKNYARKQHLPKNISDNRYDENDLRVLYHQPHKKRKAKLNEIRSKYY